QAVHPHREEVWRIAGGEPGGEFVLVRTAVLVLGLHRDGRVVLVEDVQGGLGLLCSGGVAPPDHVELGGAAAGGVVATTPEPAPAGAEFETEGGHADNPQHVPAAWCAFGL